MADVSLCYRPLTNISHSRKYVVEVKNNQLAALTEALEWENRSYDLQAQLVASQSRARALER